MVLERTMADLMVLMLVIQTTKAGQKALMTETRMVSKKEMMLVL